ncbi:unnamed protein product [Bathycoccus prasinos]|jgi:hypothetical protein|tara:strand:- start:6625 stop:8277 length:1653 start_codon:yes stop_codon:yes gene_type:complete
MLKRTGEFARRVFFGDDQREEEEEYDEEEEVSENGFCAERGRRRFTTTTQELEIQEEEEKKNTGKSRRRRQSTWYANKKKTSIRATISKIVVSLSILLTLCAMLAQTLVYVEREEEAKRREEAREDYQRAKEAMEKLFSSSSSLPCEDGGKELMLPPIETVESCRIIEEKSSTSITSSLLFNQSCLNVNAPEASGVIEELPLNACSIATTTNTQYYFPIAEIYIHYREDLEEKKKLMELQHWNFKGAFFFVMTVFTTIGYGNVAPSTKEGRLVVLLTTIPVLAVSLITIVTIAEPIIDSMNLLHKYLLKRMKKKLPIDITIPQKCTLEEYFNVLQHHLIGEAFWPMTEVYIRTNQIYTLDELHKGEVFVSKQQFVETCQGLGLRINHRTNVSTEAEVSAEEEEQEQESVLNLEEIRLLLEVIRSKASLTSTGVQLMHCLLFSVLSVVVGMFYFKALQDWDYLEAAYFAVVSITSVGLGDYVPNHQEGSVAFWYPYVFIGFGFITVFIGTLATFAEKGREKRLYEIEFRYVHECYNTKRKSWNTNTYWDDT